MVSFRAYMCKLMVLPGLNSIITKETRCIFFFSAVPVSAESEALVSESLVPVASVLTC